MDERFQRTSATETDNYLTDALGSTVALTDPTGASQVEYSYGPYGSQSVTGTTTNSYAYTGREFDGLGIDYYRARYYNPAIGRFLSEDPLGFAGGGANFYAYAGDSPIDFNDPLGLDKKKPPPHNPQCNNPGTRAKIGATVACLVGAGNKKVNTPIVPPPCSGLCRSPTDPEDPNYPTDPGLETGDGGAMKARIEIWPIIVDIWVCGVNVWTNHC